MKRILLSLMAAGLAALWVPASAQPADQPGPPPEMGGGPEGGGPPPDMVPGGDNSGGGDAQTAKTTTIITPSRTGPSAPQQYAAKFAAPAGNGTNALSGTNDINLNFAGAPLEEILNYLSDAAGFIVVQETRINSNVKVTVSGKHLSRPEAVDLLNSVLNQNGYAAIRDGRTLTIVDKNDAKTREIPVRSGNKPEDIPKNAEIVTQIIPIRFVEARQLVSDLSSFVSPQATVVANEAGNSIVITDTQANIHHLAEIIKAIDDSAEAETEIRVFPLEHANPTDVASELSSVFPSSSSGSTTQSPIRFGGGGPGGPGGFFARMMANSGGASSSSSSDRIKKATQVTAVADLRTSSVIVSAPKDLMQEIADMMKELDVASSRDQDVYVYKLNNGDPQQVAQVLQNMFQTSSSRSTTGSSQNSALQQRAQNSTQQMSSQSSSGFGSSSMGSSGGRTGGTP
jgi:general secretion pathway protein D